MSAIGSRVTKLSQGGDSKDSAGDGETNPARAVLNVVGEAMSPITEATDAANMAVAKATQLIAQVLPEFPAARLFADIVLGLPHGHAHPPTYNIPLPSVGPVICAGAQTVLINGLPSARCGDMGFGVWCGGYVPIFEVMTGSSHVFIVGARPARQLIDITSHCQKGAGFSKLSMAMMAAGAAFTAGMGALEVMANQAESDESAQLAIEATSEDDAAAAAAQAQASAGRAAGAAAQASADLAAMAMSALMGVDPWTSGVPLGMFITGSPNVLIGGFPMPGWGTIFSGLGKLLRKWQLKSKGWQRVSKSARNVSNKLIKNKKWRNRMSAAICTLTGHPVDVATGKVLTDDVDFELPGPLPLAFRRTWYSTSDHNGDLGHGWHHSLDMALWLHQGATLARLPDGRWIDFDPLLTGQESFNLQEQLTLRREEDRYVLEDALGVQHLFEIGDGLPRIEEGQPLIELPLRAIQDPNGNRIELEREGRRLVNIWDSAGRRLRVENDLPGRITAIFGPHPDRGEEELCLVRYAYSAAGDLAEASNAAGVPFTYTYKNHLLVKETNRAGTSFFFEYDRYDRDGKCVKTWGDKGIYAREIVYDEVACSTTVTDSRGAISVCHYNELGLVEREIDPLGNEHLTEWNGDGKLVAEVNPQGHRTEFTYDERGRLTVIKDAEGAQTQYRYDDVGDLVSVTSPEGSVTLRTYDERRNLKNIIDPLGNPWTYLVDERGLTQEIIDPKGNSRQLFWDRQGNLIRSVDRTGAETQLDYDALGRATRRVDAMGAESSLTWDEVGNLVAISDGEGRTSRFLYDAASQVTQAIDPAGRVRQYRYGPQGVVKATIEPTGMTTRYRYDKELDLVAVVDNRGREWRFERDGAGQVIREVAFDGRSLSFEHDEVGNLTSSVDARGQVTNFERDTNGRVLKKHLNDGEVESFRYDKDGRLVACSNSASEVAFVYDPAGRVIEEHLGEDATHIEYDACGNRIARTSPFGRRLELTWDEEDRLASLSDAKGELMALSYDPLGREIERQLPGGLVNRRSYLKTGETTEIRMERQGRLLHRRAYTYEVSGRMRTMEDSTHGLTRYEHDSDGRLTATLYPDRRMERYLYDRAGNVPGVPEGPRLKGQRGRVGRVDGWRLLWDDDGNLLEKIGPKKGYFFKWDGAGRLAQVEVRPGHRMGNRGRQGREEPRPPELIASFGYDPLGRRVFKQVERPGQDTERVDFLWDGDVLIGERCYALSPECFWQQPEGGEGEGATTEVDGEEVDEPPGEAASRAEKGEEGRNHVKRPEGKGEEVGTERKLWPEVPAETAVHEREYVFRPDSFEPLAELGSDVRYIYECDSIGTPRAVWSGGRQLGNTRYATTTWGAQKEVRLESDHTSFGFQGQYNDSEIGLKYNRFRYYDPKCRCYTSCDPVGLLGGLSTYNYVDDPLVFADPYGLAKTYCGKSRRWRDEKGQYANRPENPAEMIVNGKVNYGDLMEWKRGLQDWSTTKPHNLWNGNPSKFPAGGFKYDLRNASGSRYKMHGHGANSAAPRFTSSGMPTNAASGPTTTITRVNAGVGEELTTSGTWVPKGTSLQNDIHIPLANSPF